MSRIAATKSPAFAGLLLMGKTNRSLLDGLAETAPLALLVLLFPE